MVAKLAKAVLMLMEFAARMMPLGHGSVSAEEIEQQLYDLEHGDSAAKMWTDLFDTLGELSDDYNETSSQLLDNTKAEALVHSFAAPRAGEEITAMDLQAKRLQEFETAFDRLIDLPGYSGKWCDSDSPGATMDGVLLHAADVNRENVRLQEVVNHARKELSELRQAARSDQPPFPAPVQLELRAYRLLCKWLGQGAIIKATNPSEDNAVDNLTVTFDGLRVVHSKLDRTTGELVSSLQD